jgi:hypothetical protein
VVAAVVAVAVVVAAVVALLAEEQGVQLESRIIKIIY